MVMMIIAAHIDQWVDYINAHVTPTATMLQQFKAENNTDGAEKAVALVLQHLRAFETHLKMRNFLVGYKMTLADVVLAITSWGLFEGGLIEVRVRKEELPVLERFTNVFTS